MDPFASVLSDIIIPPLPAPPADRIFQAHATAILELGGRSYDFRAYFRVHGDRTSLDLHVREGNCPALRFETFYVVGRGEPGRYDDGRVHRYWNVHRRRVQEPFRRRGLATACLRAYETVVRHAEEVNPHLAAAWIKLDTQVGGVARLAVRCGFVPHPLDEAAAAALLGEPETEFSDALKNRPMVRFWKNMVRSPSH